MTIPSVSPSASGKDPSSKLSACGSTVKRVVGSQMISEGCSTLQIANELQVDARTVRRWRHRVSAERVIRPRLLDSGTLASEERDELVGLLSRSPALAGFAHTYFWTTRLVRQLIRDRHPRAVEGRMCLQLVRGWLVQHGFFWKRNRWIRSVGMDEPQQKQNLADMTRRLIRFRRR